MAAGTSSSTPPSASSRDDDPGARPGRNALTLGSLHAADEVVIVGSADPVGSRGLVELREVLHGAPRASSSTATAHAGLVRARHGRDGGGVRGCAACTSRPRTAPRSIGSLVAGRTLPEVGDSRCGRPWSRSPRRWCPRTDPLPVRREEQVEPGRR
ncbi:MAG: hypothetical protein R2734_07955 [Nocardioides sp.]